MGRLSTVLLVIVVSAMSGVAHGQGGQGAFGGGGGFGGGGIPGQGGVQGGRGGVIQRYEADVRRIENGLAGYLNATGVRNILTPGEFSQWTLKLKKGQVVIADAKSDVFDPAIQIIKLKEGEDEEALGTTLKENDDRFPGDQRPLLIWRCEEDGEYLLRVRCFRDKSGGQFVMRMNTYDTLDVSTDKPKEMALDGQQRILFRLQLKAGDIQQIDITIPDNNDYIFASLGTVISPIGLPDINLTSSIDNIFYGGVMASVDGDYYVAADTSGAKGKKIRAQAKSLVVKDFQTTDQGFSAKAQNNQISLWKFDVKKGDVLKVALNGLHFNTTVVHAEMPDISNYSLNTELSDEQSNPFFPRVPKEDEEILQPSFTDLPGRARDNRISVFVVNRDATLWLCTNGAGPEKKEYTVEINSATQKLEVEKDNSGTLVTGYTDYWEFDAKAGDVMTFESQINGFAGNVSVLDPELRAIFQNNANPDQSEMDWNLIINTPGKYLVLVSAIGDGGSGSYSLNRVQFSAQAFSRRTSAKGDLSSGQAEVWTFTAVPETPLYIHWLSENRDYSVSIIDELGRPLSLNMTRVDDQNQFGIIKVNKTTKFVIVLISKGKKVDYEITLSSLPGYKKGG